MALLAVNLDLDAARPPPDVRRFLREARRRVRAFTWEHHLPAFSACDFASIYRVLRALEASGHLPGQSFCEWGSGLGVVTCLAAMLGFEARGIEAEPDLVEAACCLANDFDLTAEFVPGNYIPETARARLCEGREFGWLSDLATDGYEAMGLDLDEFDLVFAYPWPDEARLVLDLFESHARSGALLLTYHVDGDLHVWRKGGMSSTN